MKENEERMSDEILDKMVLRTEIKFAVCFLTIFVCGVIPWLIGVNFMFRWIYKLIF